ncbi:MAG: YihA family ribosome biogenesis GTP-binding protein [Bacteroidetes bacterium]|uniref:Probable GTP-binding protein EngB n=1 Tax=Candidatus Caccoplasma merdipullorum TaxID=2840718 RepID=A0A9D9E4B7_9BACT|nr:YihA family ribosome biogenesis GTP-binding protein [Candidatus Caccoplasma merdipullorum]
MNINEAKFVTSSVEVSKCPNTGKKEYAFIGRSNVGKSSLINMLTGIKGLAMTSSMPGKTQCINHFIINNSWYVVDLPGYGYARCGKEARERLRQMIEEYVTRREEMYMLFVLVDSRHAPQKIDIEFIRWLGENGIPFSIVFTKADKLGKVRLEENIAFYKTTLLEEWEELPPIFITSSEDKRGREEILDYIDTINKME